MSFEVRRIEGPEIAGLRARRVEEMSGQVVHHSIHQRDGWTVTHGLELDGRWVGFGSIAIAGPWTGRPTVFEFYLDTVHRCRAFEAFEAFRRRGFGAFLVQELKRCCRELGAVPAARCNVGNTASRQTLQRAGFAPRGHMLLGDITR